MEIQSEIDRDENSAWRYLEDFYEDKAGRGVYKVTDELREVIREIEQRAEARKETLYSTFQGWLRISLHESVQNELTQLRAQDEEDFWIVIDAHDVAANVPGETELATTNPAEFADDQIKEEILGATAIDSIKLVFVSREYSPSALRNNPSDGSVPRDASGEISAMILTTVASTPALIRITDRTIRAKNALSIKRNVFCGIPSG
ncbi:hypothetical protein EL22_25795 [Halostagnicola sp. A56]|uniref:hypothetical protein n=1 Tax=Halostagnicola sp. A56 TaxID=1495067 RepID=UPI00065F6B4C|nr:hypothetical protein [Halostagnicola sp. A56]KDE56631.2 hypothetical protein EL22_25795 [Halostagnicola sp. A56]